MFMLPEWLWAISCGHSFDLHPYGITLNLARSKYNPVYQSKRYVSLTKKYKYIRKFRNHGNSMFAATVRGRKRHLFLGRDRHKDEMKMKYYGSYSKKKNCKKTIMIY